MRKHPIGPIYVSRDGVIAAYVVGIDEPYRAENRQAFWFPFVIKFAGNDAGRPCRVLVSTQAMGLGRSAPATPESWFDARAWNVPTRALVAQLSEFAEVARSAAADAILKSKDPFVSSDAAAELDPVTDAVLERYLQRKAFAAWEHGVGHVTIEAVDYWVLGREGSDVGRFIELHDGDWWDAIPTAGDDILLTPTRRLIYDFRAGRRPRGVPSQVL